MSTVAIEGMSCQHCVRAVREALEGVDGLTIQRVEIGSAEVTFADAAATDQERLRQLTAAVEEAGFSVSGVTA